MKRKETLLEEKIEEVAAVVSDITTKNKPLVVIRISKKAGMILGVILVATIALSALAVTQHWGGLGLSPEARAEREVIRVVASVEKLIVLPEGETPIVATITDAVTLKADQSFYEQAENGDVLLVYNQAQRAILYRPSTHRLINVAPIYFNDQAVAPTAAP